VYRFSFGIIQEDGRILKHMVRWEGNIEIDITEIRVGRRTLGSNGLG
jgi:hypothetical protein